MNRALLSKKIPILISLSIGSYSEWFYSYVLKFYQFYRELDCN